MPILTWERQSDGSLIIQVPAISTTSKGVECESSPCRDCPSKDRTIARLDRACPQCAVLGERVHQLVKEVQKASVDQRQLGKLEQELFQTRPAFSREQESLQRSLSARVGERGEKDTRSRLLALIGSHADVKVTNTRACAGDLQLLWHPDGLPRAALITVEVKTAQEAGQGMLKAEWVRQAESQVRTQKADAGLLLFTGAVDSTHRLLIKRDARLVIAGFSEEKGQILSALLHVLLLAQQRLACESMEGKVLTLADSAAGRNATSLMQEHVQEDRRALYDVAQLADKALKRSRIKIGEVCEAVACLPPTAATLFTTGFATMVALPRERLVKPSSHNSNNTIPYSQKRKLSGM
jgi:hypothetical protein